MRGDASNLNGLLQVSWFLVQVHNKTELDAKRRKYASATSCHLLPHVLQIMPRNPKYDQFQSKRHHNQENPQCTTKMPGNPNLTYFTSENGVKIRKINQMCSLSNRFWRWSGYISMQNVRSFRQWVLQEITRYPKFDAFHYDKIMPKIEKSTDHDYNLKISEGGQDTSACRIPGHSSMSSPGNAPRSQIWPVSLS